MKTVVDMTGNGIGPRGSADVRIRREYPDLVGAYIFNVDNAYRSELRNRKGRKLDSFNVTEVTASKVPMLIALYNPKYSDAEFPCKEYPDAESIMKEFDEAYAIVGKWLKKSMVGVKLRNKFHKSGSGVSLYINWDCVQERWNVHIMGEYRHLPEMQGVVMPSGTNQAGSYVERFYSDEEVDAITEDDVNKIYENLYALVRSNKCIFDANDALKALVRDFENKYLAKNSIYTAIDTFPEFKGVIKIYTSSNDPKYYHQNFSSAQQALDKVKAMTLDDIYVFAKNNDLLIAPRPPVVKKTEDEEKAEKKKRIAKMKKKTEVAFDDFLTDLANLASKQ